MQQTQSSATPLPVGALARMQRFLVARIRGGAPTAQPPSAVEQLQEARRQIDTLDHELIRLLSVRAALVREALVAKNRLGRAVIDPDRERSLLEVRRQWGRARGLEAEAIADIFTAVIAFARGLQGASP